MKIVVFLFCFALLANSCELFTTREPETPETGRDSFLPPTSPQIVIDNFVNSMKEKNSENFISCLGDSTGPDGLGYSFVAASDAASRYPGLFDGWDRSSERRWVVSLFSSIESEVMPALGLRDTGFEVITPDSAVYAGEYLFETNHKIEGKTKVFGGRFVLTMRQGSSGHWVITSWRDYWLNGKESWSVLKGLFLD